MAARVLQAGYIPQADYFMPGIDFESVETTAATLATSFTIGAYGVCQLRLETADAGTLRLTATNSYSGATEIKGGTLEISDGGTLGGGIYTNTIVNNSQLRFENSTDQNMSNVIYGVGTLLKSSSAKSSATQVSTIKIINTALVRVFDNTVLADLTNVTAMLGNGMGSATTMVAATTYYFVNNGTNATCQFQVYNGSHTKCAKVEFIQDGAHIMARRVYSKYVSSKNVLGIDFDTGLLDGVSYTVSENQMYQVWETTMNLLRHSYLTLSGDNSYSGGTVVERGRLEINGTTSSLPESGGIVVRKDAELLLNLPGDPSPVGSVGGNNPIYVQGGRLTINGKFNAGYLRKITIDGGVLDGTCYANNGTDNYNYINNLALINGAVVTGYKLRVGYNTSPNFYIMGTNSSAIPAGIRLVRYNQAPTTPLTLNVANATGDEEPDLYISGDITDFGGNLNGMPILKTGAGSVSFSGNNSYTGLTTVAAGALVLASDTALKSDNRVLLDGGALEMQGFANQIGTLSVGANGGEIRLGDGALYFADSSTADWNGTLTLSGTLIENTIRFGNDSTALTKAQLDAINYDNDVRIRINSSGYLTATPGATLIIIR